jgi:hypothetical protein
LALTLVSEPHTMQAQVAPASDVAFAQIGEADVRGWLTYLSSDLMQGRQVFTEGYGLAASYIAGELKAMGLAPLGDNGTYLQAVTQRSYHVTRRASITIDVGGQSKTFRHGDHVIVPVRAGGRQTLRFTDVEFAGTDRASEQPRPAPPGPASASNPGRLVLYLANALPRATQVIQRNPRTRVASGAGGIVMRALGAAAAIGYVTNLPPGADRDRSRPDFMTTGRVDAPEPPAISADDTVFTWIFSKSGTSWADIQSRAAAGDTVPSVTLRDVRITIDVDNIYDVLETNRTENVVGMVEGTDPVLKRTYVFFGAHLDHMGYVKSDGQSNGPVNVPVTKDPIWNGADDDGSGSTAVLAIAKAFATGPKPKRSVVFVWHAGEEAGLLGSRYMADFPVVPIDSIQAELNIDMIGRNRNDDASEANTVYVIGADRISTDLHNLIVDTNRALEKPLTLDYEFNAPDDPNDFYTRSDHYSYASKGIPIAFFFTGEHPDYHANTDSVDKIIFPKLVRIAQFIYETGFAIADSARPLEHDNQGPRSGKGFRGRLERGKQ